MLSYLFCCFKCFWYFCIFWHFFPILYEVINVDYLSHLKNKSVLPLKNFSFTIKSMAPSNIKCLKNVVLIGSFHFHNVFSIHYKRKVKGFHIYLFSKDKNITVSKFMLYAWRVRRHLYGSVPVAWSLGSGATWPLWDLLALRRGTPWREVHIKIQVLSPFLS